MAKRSRKPNPTRSASPPFTNKDLIVGLLKIGATPHIDSLFDLIIQEAPRLVGATECSIFWKEGPWRDEWREEVPGPPNAFFRRATYETKRDRIGTNKYELGEGLTGWVAKHGVTVRIDDIDDEPSYRDRYPGIKWADKDDRFRTSPDQDYQRAFLAVPINVDDGVVGVIRIARTIQPRAVFTDENQELLEAFAEHIGRIVGRVEQVSFKELWDDLFQTGIKLNRGDFASYLQRVTDQVPRFLGAQACSLFLQEFGPSGPELRLRATTTGAPLQNKVGRASYAIGEGLTGWVAKYIQALCLRDVDDESELAEYENLTHKGKHEEYVKSHSSFLACPIYIEDTVFGVIRVAQDSQGESFSASDQRNLEYFARNLAVLVQNVSLFESLEVEKEDALDKLGRTQNQLAELTRVLAADLAGLQRLLPDLSANPATGTKQFGPIIVDVKPKDRRKVFVGMPFSSNYMNAYKFAIRPAVEEAGFVPWIAFEEKRAIDIMRKLYEAIQSCHIGIVDISEWNANVLFELGILYERNQPVLLLKREGAAVPTDLAGFEYIPYGDYERLHKEIVTRLRGYT